MERFLVWILRSVRAAGWAPLVVFGLHAVVSVTGAYGVVPMIDIPMHLAGGAAIAFFWRCAAELAVEVGMLGQPNRVALSALVLGGTCAAAVFWEFAEWGHDQFFVALDARGYHDTLLDLALSVVGGASYVLIWWRGDLRGSETVKAPS